MSGVKTIRALSRGLAVMRSLEADGPAALYELAARTGLSKPTLLRVLLTLEQEGYVRRGIGDQLYHHTVRTVPNAESGWKAVVAEVAAPILDRLCSVVLWPSDLGIYEDGAIHVQETTRRLSPFLLNRDVLSAEIHVLPSAMGRAVLAWSRPERRNAILKRLVERGRRADAMARDSEAVEALLKETVGQGYATRMRGYYITHRREADVSAIARPIMVRGEAIGAVNLTWVSSALGEREFAARYLGKLNAAARDINEALAPRFDRIPEPVL
ncbi:helix-turn-helix domain-containing protein [Chelativorans salis]|uniref:Helix-turn-helix domain-containing protein n=1 Tax=Chelativorans salis TaxID=2978478 RepID=A0ABT2LTK8_9HYPH|nr:helix-turn-helix domain-containing protein [Chelativorans sp. EGI FJ00035]MCT7377873.1 helix-turn-helix domain-containing protein [Chelativorans sp. EGI FJ00035]